MWRAGVARNERRAAYSVRRGVARIRSKLLAYHLAYGFLLHGAWRIFEAMSEPTLFARLMTQWGFRPIPHCPGRFVLGGHAHHLTPCEIIGMQLPVVEYEIPSMTDKVLVVLFDGGALLTFVKPNGVHVHTLNTPEGLKRRLLKLGIL